MLTLLIGLLTLSPAEALSAAHPEARLLKQRHAQLLTGLRLPLAEADPRRGVERLIAATPALAARALRFEGVEARRDRAVLRFTQLYEGRPLEGRGVIFTVVDGAVRVIQDRTAPIQRLRPATITRAEAEALARSAMGVGARSAEARPLLLVDGDEAVEAYDVTVWAGVKLMSLRIDAAAGRVIGARRMIKR